MQSFNNFGSGLQHFLKSRSIYTVNAVIEYPREYELRSNPTP
jgi:hypothetical protein